MPKASLKVFVTVGGIETVIGSAYTFSSDPRHWDDQFFAEAIEAAGADEFIDGGIGLQIVNYIHMIEGTLKMICGE